MVSKSLELSTFELTVTDGGRTPEPPAFLPVALHRPAGLNPEPDTPKAYDCLGPARYAEREPRCAQCQWERHMSNSQQNLAQGLSANLDPDLEYKALQI